MTDFIGVDQRDGVVHITLDRPERKNALTRAMYTRLADALDAAAADPTARVVCISGHPECFSAGNDMADFMQMAAGEDALSLADQPAFRFLKVLHQFPKPVLAGVCGPAVGIGTTMLLHCDHVVAGRNAVFSTPFVSLGLCCEAGASVLLPRLVGPRVASDMLLSGRQLRAEEALQYQLVSELVDVEEVKTVLQQRAANIAAMPSSAVIATKALMVQGTAQILGVMAAEGLALSQLLFGEAAKEAFAAFMQKRRPDFSAC